MASTKPKQLSDCDSAKTATDVRAFLPMEKCNFEIIEAAQVLSLSRSGVYDLITDGNLATFTHGRRRLVPGAELARVQAEFAAQATRSASGLKPRRRALAAKRRSALL